MAIYYYDITKCIVYQSGPRLPSEVSSVLTKNNKTGIVEYDGKRYCRTRELLEKSALSEQQANCRAEYNKQICHYFNSHNIQYRNVTSDDSDYYYADIGNDITIRIRVSNHPTHSEIRYIEFRYGKPIPKNKIVSSVVNRIESAIKRKRQNIFLSDFVYKNCDFYTNQKDKNCDSKIS